MAYINPLNTAYYQSIIYGLTGVTPSNQSVSINVNDIPVLEAESGILVVYPANTATSPLHVTLDSTSVAVTGTLNSVGFPTPAGSQTLVNWSDTAQNGNNGMTTYTGQTVTNLRTNTASKTFYMTSLTVTGDATGQGYFSIHDGATQIFAAQFSGAATSAGTAHFTFPVPLKFGTAVRFAQWYIANKACSIMFSGFEQ